MLCPRGSADLLVFPEYSAVFFAFFGTNLQSLQGGTIKEGLAFLKDNFGVSGLKDFFLLKSSDVRQAMDRIWGSLAREYGTAILGGSYFAAEGSGKTMELRNRAVLYGSDGTTEYFQDKVFPTPFERDIVEVQPGDIDSAAAVCFQGYTLGFSICRDTFFPVWEEKFADVDLWIDIKANGEIYTPEQAEIFRGALPERLRNLPDTTGMTVCLNGSFLDLLWEGPVQCYPCKRRSLRTRYHSHRPGADSPGQRQCQGSCSPRVSLTLTGTFRKVRPSTTQRLL